MRDWKYIRLFQAGSEQPDDSDILALCNTIKSIQDNTKNNIPAGYTYFGQFIAHDLTFLENTVREPAAQPVTPDKLTLRRNPTLNLDSLYGGGLDDSQIPFNANDGSFVLGLDSNGEENDLPREDSGRARIGDPRNDENFLVAQIQLLFMKLHNKLIKRFQAQGYDQSDSLFELARIEVIRVYQFLVLHDFARRVLPGSHTDKEGRRYESVYDVIIRRGLGQLMPRDPERPAMCLEFAGAAFRFGHSMVDTQYDLNFINGRDGNRKRLQLPDLFRNTGTNISYQNALKGDLKIDWRFFFDFSKFKHQPKVQPNLARKIDLSVNLHMLKIPGENAAPDSNPTPVHIDIAERNIQRGRELGLQSGQAIVEMIKRRQPSVASQVGLEPLDSELPFYHTLKSHGGAAMVANTPLWVYILLEADVQQDSRLGTLGGWIVADGLLAAAECSEVKITPDWSIESLLAGPEQEEKYVLERGPVDMANIVVFVNSDATYL